MMYTPYLEKGGITGDYRPLVKPCEAPCGSVGKYGQTGLGMITAYAVLGVWLCRVCDQFVTTQYQAHQGNLYIANQRQLDIMSLIAYSTDIVYVWA